MCVYVLRTHVCCISVYVYNRKFWKPSSLQEKVKTIFPVCVALSCPCVLKTTALSNGRRCTFAKVPGFNELHYNTESLCLAESTTWVMRYGLT